MKALPILMLIAVLLSSFTTPHWKLTGGAVNFEIKHAGMPVKGSFQGLASKINFDPEQPENSSISATIDASTIDTGIGLRNKHLKKEIYFDVEKYPQITMQSTKIEKAGNNAYKGYFDITLKGITRQVLLPFTFTQNGNTGEFKGELKLNRLDYNIGESNWLMANDVTVQIQVNVTL